LPSNQPNVWLSLLHEIQPIEPVLNTTLENLQVPNNRKFTKKQLPFGQFGYVKTHPDCDRPFSSRARALRQRAAFAPSPAMTSPSAIAA
jgi:hypothetical protein